MTFWQRLTDLRLRAVWLILLALIAYEIGAYYINNGFDVRGRGSITDHINYVLLAHPTDIFIVLICIVSIAAHIAGPLSQMIARETLRASQMQRKAARNRDKTVDN